MNCKGHKYQKQPKATIIRRPSVKDLSLEADDDAVDLIDNQGNQMQNVDPRIVVPPNAEQAHLGVYFQFDDLAHSILKSDAYYNRSGRTLIEARKKVLVSGRLEKWKKMISYGLDAEFAARIITK